MQVPKGGTRAGRLGLKLALTGITAFVLSLAGGAAAIDSKGESAFMLHVRRHVETSPAQWLAPSPRSVAMLSAKRLDVEEPAALVRLVPARRTTGRTQEQRVVRADRGRSRVR